MKSIKYILSTIMLLVSIISNAQWNWYLPNWGFQAPNGEKVYPVTTPATVYTPKNNSVAVTKWLSGDWTGTTTPTGLTGTKKYINDYWNNQYMGLIHESEATVSYNCYAYSWAGSTTVWMNWPQEQLYITDGSYHQVSAMSAATKVAWVSVAGEHIGNVLSSTRVSSKWGPSPRYNHDVYSSPYSSTLRYYAMTPLQWVSHAGGAYNEVNKTIYASGGYAGTSLFAYYTVTAPTSYVWSATWSGQCDRWYSWPSGNKTDISVYLNPGDSGGLLRVECAMYNGGTLLGTGTYYLTVAP